MLRWIKMKLGLMKIQRIVDKLPHKGSCGIIALFFMTADDPEKIVKFMQYREREGNGTISNDAMAYMYFNGYNIYKQYIPEKKDRRKCVFKYLRENLEDDDMVLLFYPKHLAAATKYENVGLYRHKGSKFTKMTFHHMLIYKKGNKIVNKNSVTYINNDLIEYSSNYINIHNSTKEVKK